MLLLQQLFAVAAQEPVVRAGVRPGDFVQHSEQFFVPDGKPAVVMRRQFQIFNSLAFCSCWGRGGLSFAIAQGRIAIRRQAVPFDIYDAMPGHVLQGLAVAPDKTGACPGLAVRGRMAGIIDGYEPQHGAPVIAYEVPHAEIFGRRSKADQAKVPAPDKRGAIKKAGHGPAARGNGFDPSIAAKEWCHVHDEALGWYEGLGIRRAEDDEREEGRRKQRQDVRTCLNAMTAYFHPDTSRH